ncbi:hypothetical protein Acr_24g0006940 [Actinidia rufa]|uniref:Uncharacterized protein n=1 Tax=Actinidia rufa TaxID=165716 RepID=A0A7J0GVG3_9ERIC|nr:hypothetical protein Acr_24g0006940 [Actinidia rufa]
MGESNRSQRRLDGLREFGNKISHEYLITYAHIEESEMGLLRIFLWPNRRGPTKGKGQAESIATPDLLSRSLSKTKGRQQGLSEVRRATTRPPQGLSKAKERQDGLSEIRLATVKPVEGQAGDNEACRTQIELILRGHREICRRPKSDSEAYWKSDEWWWSLSDIRRGQSKPVVLKSNLNKSISRTSSVQQPSRRRLVNVRRR